MFKETGIRMSVSFPLPKPLFDRTSRLYPTFNMAIPDQYRVDVFEQELRERWESGREPFPQLRDDGAAAGSPDGRASRRRLPVSRVVHGGQRPRARPHHADAVAQSLVAGDAGDCRGRRSARRSRSRRRAPFDSDARRPARPARLRVADARQLRVDHEAALPGAGSSPPLNQFDAVASLPIDVFSPIADRAPYDAKLPDRRLFDPDAALKPFDRRFNWKALAASPVMDDPDDMRRQLPPQPRR